MDATCLVMSGDDALRARLLPALRRAGLVVMASRSPLESLLCLQAHEIAAVVCDLAGLAGDPKPMVVVRSLRGHDSRKSPLIFTLGGFPADPALAVHIERETPAAWISAHVVRTLSGGPRFRAQTPRRR